MTGLDAPAPRAFVAGRSRQIRGRWLGVASMLASAASYGAFRLYAQWHADATRIHRARHPDLFGPPRRPVPEAAPWPGVEGMNLLRLLLALFAICLLVLALRRRSWGFGVAAFAAAALCLRHVMIVF